MKKTFIFKAAVTVLSMIICLTCIVCAGEDTMKVLGEKTDKSKEIIINNKTGEIIEYINFSKFENDYSTEFDLKENLLSQDDVIENEESRILYYEVADEEQEEEVEKSADARALSSALIGNFGEPEYIVKLKFKDNDNEYIIHTFKAEGVKSSDILFKDDIVYVEYIEGDAEPVSTYDAEKSVFEYELIFGGLNKGFKDYDDFGGSDFDDDSEYDIYDEDDQNPQGADACFEGGLFY